MSKKVVIILIGIAGFGLGIYTLWRANTHQTAEVRKASKLTSIDDRTKDASEQVPAEALSNIEHEREIPENGTALVKSLMTAEQLAHLQDYFKVTESEEFRKFLETNPTLEERFHFLSDRGIGDLPRNLNMLLFRESFPTGEPADFEPEMRQKLTQMLITGGVVPIPTAPPQITSRAQALTPEKIDHIGGLLDQYGIEETLHRLQASDPALAEVVQYGIENAPAQAKAQEIIREFWEDKRIFDWQMGYFKGNISGEGGSYEWSQEVLAQVTSPRAAEPSFTETSDQLSPIQDERSAIPGVPAGMEPTDYEESALPITPPAADLAHEMPDDVGSEEAVNLAEMFTEFSKQFTEEGFETTLQEKFSPRRLEKAMQFLNRYGPKEGLRRLKESDPEVAKQIERHIHKSNDPH